MRFLFEIRRVQTVARLRSSRATRQSFVRELLLGFSRTCCALSRTTAVPRYAAPFSCWTRTISVCAMAATPSFPDAYNEAIDGIVVSEGVGSCGTAASRGAAVHVSDVALRYAGGQNDCAWRSKPGRLANGNTIWRLITSFARWTHADPNGCFGSMSSGKRCA